MGRWEDHLELGQWDHFTLNKESNCRAVELERANGLQTLSKLTIYSGNFTSIYQRELEATLNSLFPRKCLVSQGDEKCSEDPGGKY